MPGFVPIPKHDGLMYLNGATLESDIFFTSVS